MYMYHVLWYDMYHVLWYVAQYRDRLVTGCTETPETDQQTGPIRQMYTVHVLYCQTLSWVNTFACWQKCSISQRKLTLIARMGPTTLHNNSWIKLLLKKRSTAKFAKVSSYSMVHSVHVPVRIYMYMYVCTCVYMCVPLFWLGSV